MTVLVGRRGIWGIYDGNYINKYLSVLVSVLVSCRKFNFIQWKEIDSYDS